MMFSINHAWFAFFFGIIHIAVALKLQPYRVSFVLGGPAAGKSTQCQKLVEEYGCVHLSAGDLLREERASGSETAELIESYIKEGAIVPVEITLNLIKKAMEQSTANRFLIDGFPRNEDNLQGWNRVMAEDAIVDSVICLECPEDECERRIIERAKTSGRSDDNLATLKKRFVTFKDITLPVIKSFETTTSSSGSSGSSSSAGNNKRAYRISGDREIEAVYADMRIAYEAMVTSELLDLSKKLLEAEDSGDDDTYTSLVSPDCQIICNTPENNIDPTSTSTSTSDFRRLSTMVRPHVRIMGKTALVTYVRLIQEEETTLSGPGNVPTNPSIVKVIGCEDTRIWQLNEMTNGLWNNVHLHRTVLGSS